LIEMLGDQRWPVRANAAQALGMIGDRSARSALEKLRTDPNEQVRGAAESALLQLP
jgi:HEAT repeat protein